MIIVVIAGGSGTRLWPLSTPARPKHLLRLINEMSMLQNTYTRVATMTKAVYVLTEKSHAKTVVAQLPQLSEGALIVEPSRRGTASAILLALSVIRRTRRRDEVVVFLHADHHITDLDSFSLAVRTAVKAAVGEGKIALIGVEPYYAATGFGYIQKGKLIEDGHKLPVYQVASFKEKPDARTAQKYLTTGRYLWNMGLFAAPIAVFENNVKKYAPSYLKHYQSLLKVIDLKKAYLKFPTKAIDTALIEKTPELVVVPGTFSWADIGSFRDLHSIGVKDELGNVQWGSGKLIKTRNSYIRSESTKPALIIGLDNIVVVDTPDGLLVCHRDYAQEVGEAIKAYWRDSKH